MKSIFRFLGFISLFFALIIQSFAIDAPSNAAVESINETSVVVTWEPVENAIMYYVYYSKTSGIDGDYENSTDLVDGTSVEIKELEIGQNYYFAVTSLDENGEESIYSNEIMLDVDALQASEVVIEETSIITDSEDFALDGVTVISYDKIELSFTNPLNDSEDAVREFKITNKADTFDSFEVISSELDAEDSSIIELTLDKNLEIGNQYEVVIVAITSATGRNIESGIDNVETFTVSEIDETLIEENIDLNSAGVEETSLVGTNIDASEVENTVLAQSENQTALPQTGAEHILILILSIILGAVVFIFKYKRA